MLVDYKEESGYTGDFHITFTIKLMKSDIPYGDFLLVENAVGAGHHPRELVFESYSMHNQGFPRDRLERHECLIGDINALNPVDRIPKYELFSCWRKATSHDGKEIDYARIDVPSKSKGPGIEGESLFSAVQEGKASLEL